MKVLILAVVLSVVQAAPPIPRQAADHATGASNAPQEQPKSNQSPAAISPTTIDTNAAHKDENSHDPVTGKDADNSIRIGELPPVSVAKDWTDYAYFVFSGLLVVVGAVQALFLYLTNQAIKRQARIMEGQKTILDKSVAAAEDNASAAKSGAEAANKNVEMFVSKERARVRVELSPFSVDDKVTTTRLVKFVITMHGTTSAFITNSGATAYYLPEEAIHEPDVGSAVMFPIYHLPKTISPGTPPIESYAFVFIGDETLVIPELESERLIIGIRGFIEYNDVFDKSRETRFRYAWSLSEGAVAGLGLIKKLSEGEWIKSGPPGDNKET